MKQIQPVSIWSNGANHQANTFNLTIINDNLSTSATMYYQLFSCSEAEGVTNCSQLADGNLVIDGTEYETWGDSENVNEDAYVICAGKLGLIII